jgi:hypothetical protein
MDMASLLRFWNQSGLFSAIAPANLNKSVKSADRPDSVQPFVLRQKAVTAIPLGRLSPKRLGATYPHTPRARSTCAYLVLLRVEIARFTQT